MKAFCICLSLCLVAAAGFAADDPYEAAILTLPEQHSHERAVVAPLTLAEAEQIALQANPQVRLAVRKVSMAESHVSGAGALDDPSLMYRGWQVPLSQPWNYNAAMNMFMIGQSFPGPGKRALRSEIAGDAVTVAKAELEATKRNILAQLREAYYDILRTGDELQVHDEQAAIARQALEAARIKYAVGKVPQQDVLKAQVALTKLIEHLVMLEQDGELARASLNTLLGRNPDLPVDVTGSNTESWRSFLRFRSYNSLPWPIGPNLPPELHRSSSRKRDWPSPGSNTRPIFLPTSATCSRRVGLNTAITT